jgi:SAM-dependent methyltransferase
MVEQRTETDQDVFTEDYAALYDAVYEAKNYGAETARASALARSVGAGDGSWRLLDIGCGTGRHAVCFARDGHKVVGVDRSASMLERASARFAEAGLQAEFHQSDIGALELDQRFDVVVALFAVLNYMRDDASLDQALATIRKHLRPGGVLVFDGWHGPGVEAQEPEQRVKLFETPLGRIERISDGALDRARRRVTVDIAMRLLRDGQPVRESHETHVMQYFFPEELRERMARFGLRLEVVEDIDAPGRAPGRESWSMISAAVAV